MRERRVLVLLTALALVGTACARLSAVEPDAAGEVVVTLTDNVISPSVIRVKAGQTIRFIITNEGRHTHEFMIGRDPQRFTDYLHDPVYEAFEVDFFEGLEVVVSGEGMPMNFSGMEPMDMSGGNMDMSGGSMDGSDDAMDMTSTTMADMTDTPDNDAMDMTSTTMAEGMDMGGADDHGAATGEEGHHGAMVMLEPGDPAHPSEPGQTSIIEIVVPADAVGVWQIGCFQEAGQHFEDGMRATLIVEA